MTVLTPEFTQDLTQLLQETLASARYLTDGQGQRTDVVLSLTEWKKLLVWLENLDDRVIVQEWLPRLEAGPAKSNTLRWADVSNEWETDD